uniref:Lipocalin n=1 Tax=Rhipicephalus zambeziensis TaxID=60191 RepID=A0A224YC01_9ACAR
MYLPVIIALFLCALLVAPAASTEHETEHDTTDEAKPSAQDPDLEYYAINRFMNISDDIWVWNTTQKNVQKCRKDINLYMTVNATFFNRSHEEDGKIKNKSLIGYFGNNDEEENNAYNEIRISDGHDRYDEILVYASEDMRCGVVRVFAYKNGSSTLPDTIDETVIWREIRVRGRPNKTITLDEGCTKDFEEYVKALKANWTSPYNETCK